MGGLLSSGALTPRGQNCLYGYLNLPTLGLLALEPRDLPPTPLAPYISASECMGTQTDQHSLGESQLGGGCMTLSWSLMLPPETREDRTKRLFRHYTVGSYDSLTSHRYWRGLDTTGTLAGPRVSEERVWGGGRWGREWVVSYPGGSAWLSARLPAHTPPPPTQPCSPLSVITSLMTRWPSCRNGTMRVLASFSGEPKVMGCGFHEGDTASSWGDVLCALPRAPLRPF